MGNCKDCKWWGRRANRKKVEWRVCNFLDREPGSLLEGWYGDALCTAATFGCVHFEPKPETTTP